MALEIRTDESYATVPAPQWMLDRWLRRGMPREAIRANGTLDVDALRRSGEWDLVNGQVIGPT